MRPKSRDDPRPQRPPQITGKLPELESYTHCSAACKSEILVRYPDASLMTNVDAHSSRGEGEGWGHTQPPAGIPTGSHTLRTNLAA